MKLSPHLSGPRHPRLGPRWIAPLLGLLSVGLLVLVAGSAQAAATPVQLGTADSFAVLAGAGITNTGPSTITGDLGTFPTTTMTGTASVTLTGTNHAGDAVAQGAKSDLVTAYDTAAGQGPRSAIPADLGGQTLTPGVYSSASSLGLTGALTLNAGGDPNAVFVFQAGSTLITASASRIELINGAQSCNVFWQVGSSATLGTASTFRGTILALTSVTATTGATIEGRLLARNGSVTLDTNTITRPGCAPAAAASTPTPTSRATAKPTSTANGTATSRPRDTGQIPKVPSGPVDTGKASRSGGTHLPTIGVLALGGAGGLWVGAALLRRRRA
jgi:hypothetical protein